ncbi:hypothetical protein CBS101457_004577 [Exobasidium rhododendri]|nr:hypothetical protein CBS101457_004577 [Exobasidium rhododendri]
MNRSAKRHRSSKVPNVKLRPAPAITSERSKKIRQEAEAEKEDFAHYRRLREAHRNGRRIVNDAENDESGDDDNERDRDEEDDNLDEDRAPLIGCVICMTGLGEEKVKLSEYALMLGGQVQGNLTEDATHLIANEPGSDKYHCALRLGLPILRPEWLRELRARWTEAVDYDFDGLMEEHRLDTFENLCVALAGITEPAERTELRKKLKSGSAKTPTTFALDGSFTHLICGDIKDSKTMEVVNKYRKRAERFTRRGESLPSEGEVHSTEMKAATNLKLVWKEWVDDCMEVGGCLDEHLYAIEEPRLTVLQRRKLKDSTIHEKKQREMVNLARVSASKRLKEVMADTNEREDTPKHFDSTSSVQRVTKKPKIDIVKFVQQIQDGEAKDAMNTTSGRDVDGSRSSVSSSSASRPVAGPADISRQGATTTTTTTTTSSSSRLSSPPPVMQSKDTREDDERVAGAKETGEEDDAEMGDMLLEEDPASGLLSRFREKSLSSLSFRIDLRDEYGNQAAKRALQARGVQAILHAKDPSPANFHVLPLGKVDAPCNTIDRHDLGTPVTRLFIERCFFESRILDLDESFALQPSLEEFPLEGVERVVVGITGFSADNEMDKKQAEIALQSAGIQFSSTLKRGHHTHLLIGEEAEKSESSQKKIQRAKEWGIHCVGLDFIDTIYKLGKVEPAVSRSMPSQRPFGRSESAGVSTIGETQSNQNLARPLEVNQHISNALVSNLRPWQRSTSGSQALLDGEESRGASFRGLSSSAYRANDESLDAASLTIQTSAAEVMALISNRHAGKLVSNSKSLASTAGRKRGRLPPSRLREGRAGSAALSRERARDGSENPSAEDLLALRKEEEDRYMMQGSTQVLPSSLNPFGVGGVQESESIRVTYDDAPSRRERRKVSELIATSVLRSKQIDEERSRGSSTETEDVIDLRSSSVSPGKGSATAAAAANAATTITASPTATTKAFFIPTIQARRQPGTCNRD